MNSSSKIMVPEGLTPTTKIDPRTLSEAKDDRDAFLAVNLSTNASNIRDDRPFVAGRLRAIGKALPEDQKDAFAETTAMVEHAIASSRVKGENGRIIFASAHSGIIQVYRVGFELDTLVVWNSSPFLLLLTRLRKDYEDYGLLLPAEQPSCTLRS